MNFKLLIFITLVAFVSCKQKGKTDSSTANATTTPPEMMRRNILGTVDILTYDEYANEDKEGKGTLLTGDIVAVPFDLVKGATSVRFIFLGKDIKPMTRGFYTYNFEHNIILLKVSGPPRTAIPLAHESQLENLYGLALFKGKIRKYPLKVDSLIRYNNQIVGFISDTVFDAGSPVFNVENNIAGMINSVTIANERRKIIQPITLFSKALDTLPQKINPLSLLRFTTNKVYPHRSKVKGFVMETNYGNISFTLYDELPEYKDNFIRLASDGFYDSLLIHRVLRDFLIQTGAADTKHAKYDDPVGFRGPGYNLPTIIKPQFFHKRGAIAASKLPSYKNDKNQSDGSQFYIVSGRLLSDQELDDLEYQKKIKFTAEQRQLYKTIGGAPFYDGEYAVFGEVTQGMDVVDAIASVATKKDDRPMTDIRIKSIRLIEK
jgi:peptidyl-prolyl cis-trans isomerase A (cyclophilin A)